MRTLSDIVLIECYLDSLELDLDDDFIELLMTEMKDRNIQIPSLHADACVNNMSESCLQSV
ncbi:Sporulation inhibitor A [Paenibacillus sp. 1_12]|uniref:sporulation histidine kinase inhibitor Sda n=1 Tax=Paenibacillus sp. 1_12 TaxID=1566278 RepID=UPI0008F17005|nr:sporulation histidine kinase inhibitor Sda [Paenibacillus sp. 1_12]SFL35693.1 Sporulation inhibitor A [Paenibacillus sp. 1_12]